MDGLAHAMDGRLRSSWLQLAEGRSSMRGFFLFVAGILIGTAIRTLVAQSPAGQAGVRLNHVAISVPDVAQAVAWYGEKLGFREVVRNSNPQGQVT